MSTPPQRIQGSKTVADVERQANIALERINGQIANAGVSGASPATIAALQSQIDQLKVLSGGFPAEGGTGAGSPSPNPSDGTVMTDGTTISGDGVNADISLVIPVALESGGTGIPQFITQVITTTGNAILAGGHEAPERPLTVPRTTTASAAQWSLPNVPDASWLTGITVILECRTDTVTMYLVNGTAGPITPISQSVNIRVIF